MYIYIYIHIPRFYSAEARVPRREKGAGRQPWRARLVLLSGQPLAGLCVRGRLVRWVVAHVGGWGPEQRGGEGGCSVAWVRWWIARSAPGFAGNFFSSEFSKGNDLRYISKGFLLVGKRVRRSAIHPPEGRLARSRGLPDNLHFSTINLTFVRLFFCGQSDWPYVREGLPPCPLSLVLEKSEAVECFQRKVIRWIDDTCLMERIFFYLLLLLLQVGADTFVQDILIFDFARLFERWMRRGGGI